MKLDFDAGKYTYLETDGAQLVLRYGEPWRDVTGDHFIGAMAEEVERLSANIAELHEAIDLQLHTNHEIQRLRIALAEAEEGAAARRGR